MEIRKMKGKRGPYFMTNVAGVVYASSDSKDVEAFLAGEDVDMSPMGYTWNWVKRKEGSSQTPRKNIDKDSGNVTVVDLLEGLMADLNAALDKAKEIKDGLNG